MNGVHDMGGMHGMGPIEREPDEPVFHESWEGRVYAITRVIRAGGERQNLDSSRHQLELLPPAEYLRMSYYERWFARLVNQVLAGGLATRDELASGRPLAASPRMTPRVAAATVPQMIARRNSARRDVPAVPRFAIGQRVRARNVHPVSHTRLPRYARGKLGVVVRDHGVFVFPDTNAQFLGEKPQHVYSVRFSAQELWGDQASHVDSVHVDLWDDYLERPSR